MAKRRKKARSAAQKAATRKMLAALHAKRKGHAAPKRKARRRRRARRNPLPRGTHRPVIKIKKGRLYRSKRSRVIPSRATFANPFLGELAMIGNPHRKRRKSAKRSHRRRSSRRYSNPAIGRSLAAFTSGPREMATGGFLQEATSVAVGWGVTTWGPTYLPASWWDTKPKRYAAKIVLASGAAALANAFLSKRVAKAVLLGGGLSILMDAYADFVMPLLGNVRMGGVDAYYGDPTGGGQEGVGAYYGDPTGGMGDDQGGDNYGSPY